MIYLQMGGFMIDLEGARADDSGVRDGVVVGRDPAGGGEGAARRSRTPGRAAERSGAARADRLAVGAAAGRDRLLVGGGGAAARAGNGCAGGGRATPPGVGGAGRG